MKKLRVVKKVKIVTKRMNVQFSEGDRSRLHAIGQHHGISESAALRLLIDREQRAIDEACPDCDDGAQQIGECKECGGPICRSCPTCGERKG